jgi:hypothetical protein
MAAREFLFIVVESAYKVAKTTPVAGTDSIYIRLDGGNGFAMRPKPIQTAVPYGGGVAINAFTVSDQIECTGQLQTKLYASQAKLLLDWATTRINSGQTAPWTTTEPVGDLASCSVYHAIMRSDGTYKRRLYKGVKVEGGSVEISRDGKIATLSLNLRASTPEGNAFDSSTDPTSTVFPAPAETAYPTDPYLFIHSAGNFTLDTSRTQFSSFKFNFTNKMDPQWFENRFLNIHRFLGRDSTLEASLYYKPTPDDRASFEGLTNHTVSLALNNGTKTTTFTFNSKVVIQDLDDDLPLDKVYMQKLVLATYFDPAATEDFHVATV